MIQRYSKSDEGLNLYTFEKISKGFIRQRPFCSSPSIGNQVDGLPIDLSKDAVPASCILPGRAPNHIF